MLALEAPVDSLPWDWLNPVAHTSHGKSGQRSCLRDLLRFLFALSILVLVWPRCAHARNMEPANLPARSRQRGTPEAGQRVFVSPRFVPGQTLRYEMEFQTTSANSRSGMVTDPEGPSKLVITWDATVRLAVLPAAASPPGSIRIRTTYEKSVASVRSDTFAPGANAIERDYRRLAGKVVEFTLDARGNVISVSGLENLVHGKNAMRAARAWIAQLAAGPGAPPGGVTIGQRWGSTQPAESLPVAGMVWRTVSDYVGNEPCRSPSPAAPDSANHSTASETCAVIQTDLELVRSKKVRNPTPREYSKKGVRTAGKWTGSGESLSYISLKTGFVVSVTQTADENMDVQFTTSQGDLFRYSGTIHSRSQIALDPDELARK